MGSKLGLTNVRLPATRDHFPSLLHAYDAKSYSESEKILRDSAGGAHLDVSQTNFTVLDELSLRFGTISTFTSDAEPVSNIEKHGVFVMVGKNSNTTTWGFTYGDPVSGQGVGNILNDSGASGYATWDSNNYIGLGNSAATGANTEKCCLLTFLDIANEDADKYHIDAGKSAVTITGDAPTVPGSPNGILDVSADQEINITANSLNGEGYMNGVYIFDFEVLPPDIEFAVHWMSENPGFIFPGWQGK